MTQKTQSDSKAKLLAIYDLGSNSLRLLIVRIDGRGHATTLFLAKRMVRLGEGAFAGQGLQSEAMDRTVAAVKELQRTVTAMHVTETIAVATAAVREATNGSIFLMRILSETGVEFNVIDGPTEAKLIAKGVLSGLPESSAGRAFVDIGGGSTELAYARGRNIEAVTSLCIGSVRAYDTYFSDHPETVGSKRVDSVCEEISKKFDIQFKGIAVLKPEVLIASSGTAQSLAEVARLNSPAEGTGASVPQDKTADKGAIKLTRTDLVKVMKLLARKKPAERAEIPGMNPKRIEILLPGATVLLTVMDRLGVKEVEITSRGLRDGILADYLQKNYFGEEEVRDKIVRAFATSFHVEQTHAGCVAGLAMALYDDAVSADLVDEDSLEREYLRYAALLHDVGMCVNFDNHAELGRYLIANYNWMGFSKEEIENISWIVRFHNERPHRKEAPLVTLGADRAEMIFRCAAFLSVAEALDKEHRGAVGAVRLEKQKKAAQIVITVTDQTDSVKFSLEKRLRWLEAALGLPVTAGRVTPETGAALTEPS